jgi:HK97 family phage major capsid protein
MWKELLKRAADLLSKGIQLNSIAKIGAGDEKDLGEYMLEREKFLEEVTKFLTDMPSSLEKEFEQINNELLTLKKNVLTHSQPEKELTKKDVAKAITRAAMYAVFGKSAFNEEESLKELKNIVFPGSFMGDKTDRARFFRKDAIDTPLDPGGTNAGLTINPIYERELLKYLPEYSDMAGFTRRMPMIAPQHSYPVLSSRSFVMTRTAATSAGTSWSDSSKIADSATGPTFGTRVTLQATTLAAYIPWIDEFADDIQVTESLDSLMLECVMEALAEDFDFNVLTADSGDSGVEYDGLLNTDDVKTYTVSAQTLSGVMPDELKTALLTIARTERDGGYWIVHESVLDQLAKVRNAIGDYMIWTPPTGENPGKLASKPYIEAHLMPDYAELAPGDTFLAYAKPENLWVGERAGLEVKKFDATIYNLEYGENFTRWRLRNGYKVVKPEASLLVKLHA